MQPKVNGVSCDTTSYGLKESHPEKEVRHSRALETPLKQIHHEIDSDAPPYAATTVNGNATAGVRETKAEGSARGRKRKLVDTLESKSSRTPKRASPPWRNFKPTNPTVFNENGKRKSGRINPLPLMLQPQGATRGKSASYLQKHEAKAERPSERTAKNLHALQSRPNSSSLQPPTRARRRNAHTRGRPAQPSSHGNILQRASSRFHDQKVSTKRPQHAASQYEQFSELDASNATMSEPSNRPVRSLRLRYTPPAPTILNRYNIPPPKRFASVQECLNSIWNAGEDQVKLYSQQEARHEAIVWSRLEKAALPGGMLHGEWNLPGGLPQLVDDKIPDPLASLHPPPVFSHQDYLCAHVTLFQKALNDEKRHHRHLARVVAHEARARWRSKQPKSEAQLTKEWCLRYRNFVLKQLVENWTAVKDFVFRKKVESMERQQRERTEQQMKEFVETQANAVVRRNDLHSSTVVSAEQVYQDDKSSQNSSDTNDGTSISGGDGYSSDDEGSDSSTSEDFEGAAEDEWSELGGEALRRRIYGEASTVNFTFDSKHSTPKLEEVDAELLDSLDDEEKDEDTSDAITEEVTGSDSNMSNSSSGVGSSDDAESSEDDGIGLWGFFSRDSRRAFHNYPQRRTPEPGIADSSNPAAGEPGEFKAALDASETRQPLRLESEGESASEGQSRGDTPATSFSKQSDVGNGIHELLVQSESRAQARTEASQGVPLTPVSSLLRGRLRVYQHQGLDWLAGLYANHENGILADEMGLGKTIQTISLLAHLATERGIWGPHLIVVPTSVMLNWEMEFKKFLPGFKILTYYGNQEERKAKRKGWLNDNRWNVCITSYQLALQDVVSLRRRNWHYIVLDEAHHIKNFRSQRWQTLLTFKSRARLLLTGTPLQNNLTELWSLLFFLNPELDEHGETRFKDLKTFTKLFNKPAEQILDSGREGLDDTAREIVKHLQIVLRPHLLRRLKADVEKQMPKKFEHVVKCRLSKRQRQLYDGYMALAGTRETFASGNYMSIIGCLMQLRKVCNHPDLFETRQIVTSFSMPKSAVADFEIKEMLIGKKLIGAVRNRSLGLRGLNLWQENSGNLTCASSRRLAALQPLAFASRNVQAQLDSSAGPVVCWTAASTLENVLKHRRLERFSDLSFQHRQTNFKTQRVPVYGAGLIQRLSFEKPPHVANSQPKRRVRLSEWCLNTSTVLQNAFNLDLAMSVSTDVLIHKFGCVTPAVVAPGIARQVLTDMGVEAVQGWRPTLGPSPSHQAQTRLSIAFPDKSLIQYDCGKLQQLDKLLRSLQSGGHRALIFTQMTKVLDILEQFLNLHGHRYLRLDGSTKVEQRQALTDQFNQDTRILAFILSSRSGGLGINLTGADTVIFYDLDWNPAMDKQCQDRCHRIGQTRDVHIYRFVSEGTIEANILRKSNQKRMLDDVVIEEGEFTTEAFYRSEADDSFDAEADAALDKVLGGVGGQRQEQRILDEVEDTEDRDAARQAEDEDAHVDDVDFEEKAFTPPVRGVPDVPSDITTASPYKAAAEGEEEGTEPGSCDDYMLRFMEHTLRNATISVTTDAQRKRAKKGKDYGIRMRI